MFTNSVDMYDLIYAAQGKDYAHEAQRIVEIATQRRKSPGLSLLDVACGTGEHLKHLARSFDEIEGLDLDPVMVERCRQKVPGATVHQGDMSDFNLKRQFDVVICLFSSIGYVATVERLEQTIRNLALHTRPGGIVLIEPWIFPENVKTGLIHATYVDQPDLKIARMAISKTDSRMSRIEFHYMKGTPAGVENFTERHDLGLFERSEYESAFQNAEFEVEFIENELTNRGLFVAVKPNTD